MKILLGWCSLGYRHTKESVPIGFYHKGLSLGFITFQWAYNNKTSMDLEDVLAIAYSKKSYTAICSICGYQWDEIRQSTFTLDCPACECNNVRRYDETKQLIMGDDYDGKPWF